jgi:bacteriocin-like protein
MKKLSENELNKIEGGMSVSAGIGIGLLVTSVLSFLAGVIKGYTNPEVCNVKAN